MGSVAPKVSVADQLQNAAVKKGTSVALFCPAQSFPVPAHRLVFGLRPFKLNTA